MCGRWDEWMLYCPDGAGSIYVTEKGEGEPLVVLHGGPGGDHGYLVDAVEKFTDHFRVVLYDQRGCLRSRVPVERVSFEANIADLRALQKELGDGPIHLLGHSAGAELAAAYVEAFPDLVGRVVLVAPPALRTGGDEEETKLREEQRQARFQFELEQWNRLLERLGYTEDDLGRLSDRESSHFYRKRDASLFLRYPERWRQTRWFFFRPEVGQAVANSMPPSYDFVAALKRHKEKVTVIVGDHDVIDLGGRLASHYFEDSSVRLVILLVILKDAGHHAWIDQPERFDEVVSEALRG